jgi:hypothetical protein
MMGPLVMKSVNGLPNGSTVAPDLVLGANDGDKHPQCIQHYQEDRSQENKSRSQEREVPGLGGTLPVISPKYL